MSRIVNIHEAKTNLSRLLAEVEAGDTVTIARSGKPVAKLVRVLSGGKRKFGALRGKVTVGPEFFEPLPADELARWDQ
jgi:prevent-host-death family protein